MKKLTHLSECKGTTIAPSHQIRSTKPYFFSTNLFDFRNIFFPIKFFYFFIYYFFIPH